MEKCNMNENENFDMVAAVKQLVEDYGHLAEEIAEVKKSIYDNLINPIQEEYKKMEYDNALSDFRCKYAEKLEPFSETLKKVERDENFDVVKKAFDDFSAREDGMEEEVYVDKLAEKIQEQLDDLAEIFGVKKEDIEEVKVETDEGEVEAKVEDGEVVEVEKEEEEEEEIHEEEIPQVEEKVEEEEIVNPEEKEEKETTASKLNKLLGNE